MRLSLEAVRSQAGECYCAALYLLYAMILFAHDAAPSMTDYANWTYQGVLFARHVQGFADSAHTLKAYPVPNSAATIGIGTLALLLPWKVAAKLWLCAQMTIFFLALRHMARTTGATGAMWMIVPQAVFLGVNWWYGFVNFELGIAWVLLFASLLIQRVTRGQGKDWVLGVVLVACFFTHMIPFTFCALMLGLYAAQTRRWRALWQLAPTAALSAWYLAGRFALADDADGRAGMAATVRSYSMGFWAYKVNSYAKSFGFVNPWDSSGSTALESLGKGLFLLLMWASVALCVSTGWLMIREMRRAYRQGEPERFLWTNLLLVLPLYWLAPGSALGISDPGSRLLQVILALALMLTCRRHGRLLQVSAACGALLAVAGALLFFRFGFEGAPLAHGDQKLPSAVAQFAHVPNHDQDFFYRALDSGDYSERVFPTGMFLNESGH